MFDKLIADIGSVVADAKAKQWGKGLSDLAAAIDDVAEIVGPFLAPVMGGTADDHAKLRCVCDELAACCPATEAVDGIFPSDGSVFKALVQFFLTVILPLLVKPAPAGS